MNTILTTIVKWLVILAMPLFIGLGSVVLVIATAPVYLSYEYGKPNFPPDPFGFTNAQREELALVAVNYLRSRESANDVIFMLEEQQLPDGSGPLYNQDEIGHMLDVKYLVDAIFTVWWVSAIMVVGGLLLLLLRAESRRAGYAAIMGGGIATTAVLLFIALFIGLAWNTFFVQFHELLFPPGTWTFAYDESLIRLFPEKFWFDIGVIMSGIPLVGGILVTLVGYLLWRSAGKNLPAASR